MMELPKRHATSLYGQPVRTHTPADVHTVTDSALGGPVHSAGGTPPAGLGHGGQTRQLPVAATSPGRRPTRGRDHGPGLQASCQ